MAEHSPKSGGVGHGDLDDQSIDVVFDLLANQRRRCVLACLTDNTQAIALSDLAEAVAVRENGGPLTDIPNEEVQAIQTSLYHIHIPKLVDARAVAYEQTSNLVRVLETADLAEHVLSFTAGD